MGPSELTLQSIAFRGLAVLVIAAVQGFVVAGVAVLLGDKGPKYDGRLTLSPIGHVDPVGAVSAIAFGLGWTKPVAIDARQFGIGRTGIVLVVLAGFVGLLVLATLLDALVRPALTMLPLTAGLGTAAFLRVAGSLAVWFALLGLIPVPPLMGGLLPEAAGLRFSREARWVLAAALLVAVATGWMRQLLAPAYGLLASFVLGG
jgi:hypothetical protein